MTRPKAAKRRSRVVKGEPAATKGRRSAGKVGRSAATKGRGPGATAKAEAYAFAKDKPVKLLTGGHPQIAKADGDAPVQAYIAAMPGWKRDVGRRLDALIVRTVPGVRKAVRWNSPFYGVEGQGWFLMNARTAGTDHGHGSRVAYGAALWALIFGVLHVAWAAGWYIGLTPQVALKAFSQPWFLAYDLLVAGVCMVAVPVALAMVRPWGRRIPRSLVGFLAWGGTGLLVLRSGASIIRVLYTVATGTFVAEPMHVWEVWFYVGAVLFGVSTWKFWAREPSGAVAA